MMKTTDDLVLRSFGYHANCGCPDCVAHRTPRWPCGRPRREWETPVPAPPDYPQHWPVITCNTDNKTRDAMSGTGPTQLCN